MILCVKQFKNFIAISMLGLCMHIHVNSNSHSLFKTKRLYPLFSMHQIRFCSLMRTHSVHNYVLFTEYISKKMFSWIYPTALNGTYAIIHSSPYMKQKKLYMYAYMKSMTKTIIIARVDLCSSSFYNRMCENIRERWNVESWW